MLAFGFLMPISYAGTSSISTKATAQLTATCSINSNNVGFGQLILPLTAQSASSNMNIFCSKNAPYTIGLAYGGIYGTSQNVSATYRLTGSNTVTQGPTGPALYANCYYTATSSDGQTSTTSTTAATQSQCPATNGNHTFSVSYGYGKIIGVTKGDSVAYSIFVPGSSSTVWNTGQGSYSSTGTGSNQIVPINAQIIPGQSSSAYPTPDVYMDTVTATINF